MTLPRPATTDGAMSTDDGLDIVGCVSANGVDCESCRSSSNTGGKLPSNRGNYVAKTLLPDLRKMTKALRHWEEVAKAEKKRKLVEEAELKAAQKRSDVAHQVARKLANYGRGAKQRRLNRMERTVFFPACASLFPI